MVKTLTLPGALFAYTISSGSAPFSSVQTAPASFAWNVDNPFIAVAFNVIHRRALMRAVHAKIRSPSFQQTVHDLQALRSVDFRRVFDILGEHGGIPQALRHQSVSNSMKNLLHMLRIVTSTVPCTDAARTVMRHELCALQLYFGFPALFVTFNPCDTRHPFTCAMHFSHRVADTVPLPDLDAALYDVLKDVNLPRLVADDPVAATKAFHLHVMLFLSHLLGCPPSSSPPDPDQARMPEGVFGKVIAFYGVTELQNRGSLHIHLLLHLAGFTSPQDLIARFTGRLPSLASALTTWASSMQHASLEAIPAAFSIPAAADSLRQLQPFSKKQRAALGPAYEPFLTIASQHWFAADASRRLPIAASAWFDPFLDAQESRPSCLPWPREYLDPSSALPADSWMRLLLYDVRHTVVQCGLHECRPGTCWKGWLGKIRYCRLGFWHWEPCSSQPRAWRRVHGHPLQPTCVIGRVPPSRGLLLPERHHPFFGKTHAAIFAATKSNHDVGLLLRAPPPDASLDAATCLQFMLTNLRTTSFYVTSYSSKVQPQLTNLWSLLMSGQASLDAEIDALPSPLPALSRASRVLHRMISACQKRVHKSMPEMLHFLLGFPEAYKSHAFQRIFLSDVLRAASHLLSEDPPHRLAAEDANILLLPPPDVDPHSDIPSHVRPVAFAPQSLDYTCRGPSLLSWPFYFYVAGVRRCRRSDISSESHVAFFDAAHPLSQSHVQVILLCTTWAIPVLTGTSIPDPVADPERFALLALVLLKPWHDPALQDLLQPLLLDGDPFASWRAALADFETSLHEQASPSLPRAHPFTPVYWSQRCLDLLIHLRNLAGSPLLDLNAAAVRVNPDAAAGVPNSVELPSVTLPADLLADDVVVPPSDPSDSDTAPFSDTLADPVPDLPAAAPTDSSQALPPLCWQEVLDACVGQVFDPDNSFCTHFRAHATFAFPTASPASTSSPLVFPRGWTSVAPTDLLHAASDWSSVLSPTPSASAPSPSTCPSPRCVPAPNPFDLIWSWLQLGRCNQTDGALNLKQAAILSLHAASLHASIQHARSLSATAPSPQLSILLGGPGTGKSYILKLWQELYNTFWPATTKTCALMHTAARLVSGRTLHSALSLPFESLNAKNKSLGDKKESLLDDWAPIRTLLLDECSTISAEVFGSAEFRSCQVKNSNLPWGGLSVHLFGDFCQLPPVLATSLAHASEPPPGLNPSARRRWLQQHAPAQRGRALWLQFPDCILLDYSHRCSGPLATLLAELRSPAGFSAASWALLRRRLIVPNDPRLSELPFCSAAAVIGVTRHSLRALLTLQRATALASAHGHRLLLLPASDRLRRDDRGSSDEPPFLRRVLAVHNLTVTKNLPGYLFLWPQCELILEAVLCPELGITRGCRLRFLDILYHPGQLRPSPNPALPPFIFDRLPAALLVEVPDATWIKEPSLGPGRFLLLCQTRSWLFKPGTADGHYCPATVHRTQFPATNALAFTAYVLQGATVPGILLDLAKPPAQSRDEFWMSLYVLLSRVTSLDHILFFRLPSPAQCQGGPPAWLKSEMARLRTLEQQTLHRLDAHLATSAREDFRALVTQPLLQTSLHPISASSSAAPPLQCSAAPSSSAAPPLRRRAPPSSAAAPPLQRRRRCD